MTNAISVVIWVGIFVFWDMTRKVHTSKFQKVLDVTMIILSVMKIGMNASWFLSKNEAFLVDSRDFLIDGFLLILAAFNYFLAKTSK